MFNKKLEKAGYDVSYERSVSERKIPFLTSFDVDSYIENISANKLAGGVIKSQDERLVIDLDNGTIKYDEVSVI